MCLLNNDFLTQKYEQGFKFNIIFQDTKVTFHFFPFN